jgi:hypothetical protein
MLEQDGAADLEERLAFVMDRLRLYLPESAELGYKLELVAESYSAADVKQAVAYVVDDIKRQLGEIFAAVAPAFATVALEAYEARRELAEASRGVKGLLVDASELLRRRREEQEKPGCGKTSADDCKPTGGETHG